MNESVSLELHRAVVAQHGSAFDVLREAHIILDGIIGQDDRKIAARLQDVAADRATNAALAARVQELEAALDAKIDEAATLRAALERVEWADDGMGRDVCPWCNARYPGIHAPDCQRQAALAGSEVKA